MSNTSQLIRDEKWAGRACVVIDLDCAGHIDVFADPGVLVFTRYADSDGEEFCFEEVNVIPQGWLGTPINCETDSDAENRANAFVDALDKADSENDDDG